VIVTFKCSDTEALFNGKRIARFVNIQVVAMRKLAMLNQAEMLADLRIPPNNKLERLKGNRRGQWSLRINDQWRLCFRFEGGHADDVEIVDYH
jgi:proteic killer suppression protein